jgi:hypothetical protein
MSNTQVSKWDRVVKVLENGSDAIVDVSAIAAIAWMAQMGVGDSALQFSVAAITSIAIGKRYLSEP